MRTSYAKEGDKDEGGEGGAFAKRNWDGERWVWVCLARTGRLWDSNVLPLPSLFKVLPNPEKKYL